MWLSGAIKRGYMEKKLSEKHQRFVEEYLIDLNASRAYRAAGYSEKAAGQCGYKLLREEKIQKAIQKEIQERSRRTHVDQDRVIKELARIGFCNVKSILKHWDNETLNVKDSDEIPDDDVAAIKEIIYTQNDYGTQVKVTLHDKLSALKTLWDHVKPPEGGKTDPLEEARKIFELSKEMGKNMGMKE